MISSARTLPWLFLCATALPLPMAADPGSPPPHTAAPVSAKSEPLPPRLPVFEFKLQDFSDADYHRGVEDLISEYEKRLGHRIAPGAKHKVGLKIYADSGPGLATPFPLVRAVIAVLQERGYQPGQIFLVGLNPLRLRLTGFLPSFATGETPFPGHPLYVLESGKFYDPSWFYDSPLPSRFDPISNDRAVEQAAKGKNTTTTEEDRKSFLATPLFLDADFWINLPVYTDHPVLGINGALVNATLWNASNTYRFFKSPATAPAAVAEMAAIPELREGWALTITSLQLYQFIGGPYFNSLYTVSEPRLWMSADPVVLDALMLERLNAARKKTGFDPIDSEEARMLDFAAQLGVGSRDTTKVPWVEVGP
ncbi:MAG TPA: DUF362 domain-containing protein [Candidatus Didemnitutus sp.]|nr:DUF362 domain-containing protein [Candidatus Didemnitutus sp.]